MKNINVHLRLGSHPLYKHLINFPPENVNYTVSSTATAKGSGLINKAKKMAWNQLTKYRPHAILLNPGKCGLIHSTYGSLVLNKRPWVVDVEHVAAFAKYHVRSLQKNSYKNRIKGILESTHCKKIMPWTIAAKKSIEQCFLSKKINEKQAVVYPAIKPPDIKIAKEGDVFKIIVASRAFFEKGGKQALDAFEILNKKYDIQMDILSIVPEEIKRKYVKFKNISFIDRIFVDTNGKDILFREYYSKANLMLHLTFSDTLSLVLLEAMSCKTPIITTDIFSMPEIVENGKNGFVANAPFSNVGRNMEIKYHPDLGNMGAFMGLLAAKYPKFINEVCSKASIIIEDSGLRKRMGNHGRKLVESGKFSIKHRNKQLRAIYEESARI